MKYIKLFEQWLAEKKPAGAPDWKDSDAPDAEGRFRDLGISLIPMLLLPSFLFIFRIVLIFLKRLMRCLAILLYF